MTVLPLDVVNTIMTRCFSLTTHHDDEGHTIKKDKSLYLPKVGSLIMQALRETNLHGTYVDPMMVMYGIKEGQSVPIHVDEDIIHPDGRIAKHSLLVYLNDDYEGGETILGSAVVQNPKKGEIAVFPHNIPHGAKPVTKGTKYVLKTDLFPGKD